MARTKLTTSPGGQTKPDVEHAWVINNGVGSSAAGWHFDASMKYAIVSTDNGAYRVTTRGYRYRLAYLGDDIIRWHRHPVGNSAVKYPHLHLRVGGVPNGDTALKDHLPAPRATVEDAIRWAITLGFPHVRDDYDSVLALTEADHLRYRSWGGSADYPQQQAMR